MRDLKYVFKSVPERFSYGIKASINETKFKSHKSHCRKVAKIVVSMVLLLTMIPVTVYGSSKLYGFIVSRFGNYGVSIEATTSVESPEFVKLIVDMDGYSEVKNTDGLKYSKTTSADKDVFSFLLTRPNNGLKELYKNVSDYKVITINSHKAVILYGAGNAEITRVSIFFENVNIIATCYVNADIEEEEIISMLEGVDVFEATKNDHTIYLISENCNSYDDAINYPTRYTLTEEDEILSIYPDVIACVDNICVIENVSEFNTEDFYFWGDDISNFVDNSGNLIPRRSDVWSFGDGINSVDSFIDSQEYKQKFVMADVTYTNYSSDIFTFSVDLRLRLLEEDANGNLKLSDIYNGDKNADDGFAQYIANSNKGIKDYYTYTLNPNETKTFTVGYRCDESQLDNAYLVNKMFSGDSTEEYAIKVQNNG